MTNISHDLIITSYNNMPGVKLLETDLPRYCKIFDKIIIVDDKSDPEIYTKLLDLSSESIQILQMPYNTGRPSEPRNTGLRASKADIITFLDIGDRIPSSYILTVRKFLYYNPNIIYSGIKFKSNVPEAFVENKLFSKNLRVLKVPNRLQNIKMFGLQSGLTFNRNNSPQTHYRVQFFEDWHFINNLLTENYSLSLVFLPILYQKDGNNISSGKIRQLLRVYRQSKNVPKTLSYLVLAIVKYSVEYSVGIRQSCWNFKKKPDPKNGALKCQN